MTHTVFVYGTLLRGEPNHGVLDYAGPAYLGPDTLAGFTLVDLGPFPGVIPGAGGVPVRGEVYEVTDAGLRRLDRLEGCPGFYGREVVTLESGRRAWVYVLPERYADQPPIPGGDWRERGCACASA